jgi:glycine hydroxymethyltransferase
VLEAQGSVMTNKYAEGYPGRAIMAAASLSISPRTRHRAGQAAVRLRFRQRSAQFRRQANQAVFWRCCKPGDTLLGMSLDAGGHLTHGARPNLSGKWFNAVQYGVRHRHRLL